MRTGMEWDEWYLEVCKTVAKKSQCLSRKIGAILVRDNAIISQGYNGPPRGVQTCDDRWFNDEKMLKAAGFESARFKGEFQGICPRYVKEFGFKSGEGLQWCVAAHAEENAILNAARLGISTKGSIMYVDCPIPCKNCLIKIINAGISEVVVVGLKFYDDSSEYLLRESGLKYRIYDHLKDTDCGDY